MKNGEFKLTLITKERAKELIFAPFSSGYNIKSSSTVERIYGPDKIVFLEDSNVMLVHNLNQFLFYCYDLSDEIIWKVIDQNIRELYCSIDLKAELANIELNAKFSLLYSD